MDFTNDNCLVCQCQTAVQLIGLYGVWRKKYTKIYGFKNPAIYLGISDA